MRRRRLATLSGTVLVFIALGATTAANAAPGTDTLSARYSAADRPTASAHAVRSAHPESAPGYPWTWPVAGARAVVEPFRAPAHDYGPGHRGMDVAAAEGAQVRAPADGVVAFAGTVVDRPLITIDHGAGYVSTFEPVQSQLAPGDLVAAGDVIGVTATGGHAPRGAVHVGVRVDDGYENPRPIFGAVPRAILLPCCAL